LSQLGNKTLIGIVGKAIFLQPEPDQPVSIIIVKSGWSGMYHLIIELGDSDTFDTFFYSAGDVEKRFMKFLPNNWKELI